MNKIFIFFRSTVSGGTATLSIRIGKWLVNNGYRVIYICQTINDKHNYHTMKQIGFEVYEWSLKESRNNIEKIVDGNKVSFLSYTLEEFIFLEKIKNIMPVDNNFLYTVSNNGLIKGESQNKIVKMVIKKMLRGIIKKLDINNSIIYPAKKTINIMQEYYNLELDKNQERVLRLPIIINDFDINSIKHKKNLESFSIITILRADFPFLGYVFGLIKDFAKMLQTKNNIELTIISKGKDFEKIKKAIEVLDEDVRVKIHLLEGVPYEALGDYFSKAHLNIGQGTTILDAANYGVPSLIVKENTYECMTKGFYNKDSDYLCAQKDEYVEPIFSYVNNVLSLPELNYIRLCKDTHQALVQNNEIDKYMSRLLEIQNVNEERVLNELDLFKMKIYEKSIKYMKNARILKN